MTDTTNTSPTPVTGPSLAADITDPDIIFSQSGLPQDCPLIRDAFDIAWLFLTELGEGADVRYECIVNGTFPQACLMHDAEPDCDPAIIAYLLCSVALFNETNPDRKAATEKTMGIDVMTLHKQHTKHRRGEISHYSANFQKIRIAIETCNIHHVLNEHIAHIGYDDAGHAKFAYRASREGLQEMTQIYGATQNWATQGGIYDKHRAARAELLEVMMDVEKALVLVQDVGAMWTPGNIPQRHYPQRLPHPANA